jgi:hypothetical protein
MTPRVRAEAKAIRPRINNVGCGPKGLTDERLEEARNADSREPCTFCGVRADLGCKHNALARALRSGDKSALAFGATPLPPEGGRAVFPPLSGRPPLQWRGQ